MCWRVCLSGLHQVFTLERKESRAWVRDPRSTRAIEWLADGHLDTGRSAHRRIKMYMKDEDRDRWSMVVDPTPSPG